MAEPTRRELLGAGAALLYATTPFRALAQPASFDWSTLVGREIDSESVYLDLVSDDGRRGCIARIGRYPTLGRCWLWGHVFDERGLTAFTSVTRPGGRSASDLEAPSVRYTEPADRPDEPQKDSGLRFELWREGARGTPRRFGARLAFTGHAFTSGVAAHPPHGRGQTAVVLEAELEPGHEPAASLSGRSEVLGTGRAVWTAGERRVELEARGHFHEQVQSRPRFVNPFVYATLRGRDWYSVAILTRQGAVGFADIDGRAWRVEKIEISPPSGDTAAVERHYALHLAEGAGGAGGASRRVVRGRLAERHVYSVPIYDRRRRGTLVAGRVGGREVSGCINDYLPEELPYA